MTEFDRGYLTALFLAGLWLAFVQLIGWDLRACAPGFVLAGCLYWAIVKLRSRRGA